MSVRIMNLSIFIQSNEFYTFIFLWQTKDGMGKYVLVFSIVNRFRWRFLSFIHRLLSIFEHDMCIAEF